MAEERTIFEKILDGEIPAEIISEGEHYISFQDIQPQAPVHVLVIPREKIRNFDELHQLPPEVLNGFMQGISVTARKLGLVSNGYRVVFNTGKDGAQSVDYIHAHILGGRQMAWPPG